MSRSASPPSAAGRPRRCSARSAPRGRSPGDGGRRRPGPGRPGDRHAPRCPTLRRKRRGPRRGASWERVMKSLFVTSVEPFIGKTAVCVALGRRLQADGYRVGYLKPVSTQPWRTPDGRLADEDAAFICEALGLGGDCTQLTPVIITPALLRQRLAGGAGEDLTPKIREAARRARAGEDGLLLEGGARP